MKRVSLFTLQVWWRLREKHKMEKFVVEMIKTVKGTKVIELESKRDLFKYGVAEDLETFGEGVVWSEIETYTIDKVRDEEGLAFAWGETDDEGKRHIAGFN